MGWTITLFIGLGLIILAGFVAVREHHWLRRAAFADGAVTELELQTGWRANRRRPMYSPRVSFTAENGSEYSFTSPISASPPNYDVGDIVRVAYDRETGVGRIMSFGERFAGAVLLAAIGFGVMSAAVAFLIGRELFARIYLN